MTARPADPIAQRDHDRRVAMRYRKRRALAELQGIPTAPIPAAPIRRHLRELIALGWGTPAILAATGLDSNPTALLVIANGRTLRCERKFEAVLNLPRTLAVPETVADEMQVPSLGSARRIRALMALGWRHEDLTALIGGRSSHHLSAHRHKTINALDWRIVDAAFEHLAGTPGPSEASRKRAAKRGFVPPLAWECIDDPDEQPVLEVDYLAPGRPGVMAARIENFDFLLGQGETPQSAAMRLGINLESFVDQRRRYERENGGAA